MTAITLTIAIVVLSGALSIVMASAWLIQQRTGNSGWVDVVWTFGLGGLGIAAALTPIGTSEWPTPRQAIVALFVAIWAVRLGWHIAHRTAGISDDPRYGELIRQWGPNARGQMFVLLQKQALVSIPLAASIFIAAHNPQPELGVQDLLAVCILAIAIAGEALADHQLRQFRRDRANIGRVCARGLWGWSRHPNYFFEWLGWTAYPMLAIDLSGAYGWGWLALAGPICMYWLLAHVSGVPPLEEHMVRSRGDAYRAYQARTSEFFPLPPDRSAERPT